MNQYPLITENQIKMVDQIARDKICHRDGSSRRMEFRGNKLYAIYTVELTADEVKNKNAD